MHCNFWIRMSRSVRYFLRVISSWKFHIIFNKLLKARHWHDSSRTLEISSEIIKISSRGILVNVWIKSFQNVNALIFYLNELIGKWKINDFRHSNIHTFALLKALTLKIANVSQFIQTKNFVWKIHNDEFQCQCFGFAVLWLNTLISRESTLETIRRFS
jgi:hypothetical protein